MADTLLNRDRPPVFCPGCSHHNVLIALDQAFIQMGLSGEDICMVSDIGCSGLFDVFFHTHAFHGLHGRALTYGAGIKLCRPGLKVVVTMGDGGLGIGGAHFLAACRRNVDMTLLILNNFNFGMTGGQYSAATPQEATVSSGFLNRLDRPMDVCATAKVSGAPFVARASAHEKGLADLLRRAVEYPGFAVAEVQGVCPGRYSKKNQLTPKAIAGGIQEAGFVNGEQAENRRLDYGAAYAAEAGDMTPPQPPAAPEAVHQPVSDQPQSIAILGAAGQRVVTAGEILGLAGLSAGLNVTQKNDYPITVLRGHSITELHLSPKPIHYTGMDRPDVVLALAEEGVSRRAKMIRNLPETSLVIAPGGLDLPETAAEVRVMDVAGLKIKKPDWALAALAAAADLGRIIDRDMLLAGVSARLGGKIREAAEAVVRGFSW
jgi:pyruvate/2-oxoacid:ferredoxin oxidoreductase beta subunit/Pyruvate/2-oxoacid:ferredoxin oxidoreductase gamma subunit